MHAHGRSVYSFACSNASISLKVRRNVLAQRAPAPVAPPSFIHAARRNVVGASQSSSSDSAGSLADAATTANGNGGGMAQGPPPADSGAGARVLDVDMAHELKTSFINYSMSVIAGRALPDARDGLKPVQRRILYAMHAMGLVAEKPHRKCARVVGEVLGKYHPHGDSAVYEALVRMAQDFKMSGTLVDGHGNFGSIDGDPAAAMRYTECRLTPLAAHALLRDVDQDKGATPYAQTFDDTGYEPEVLAASLPNLLLNGTSGIAVGYRTQLPPHSLADVVRATRLYLSNPDGVSDEALCDAIVAPDFPTGGHLLESTESLRSIYTKGSGTLTVRGVVHYEEASTINGKREPASVVVTELPYQGGGTAALAKEIQSLCDKEKMPSAAFGHISMVRDESSSAGVRLVVQLKRTVKSPDAIVASLFKYTRLEERFSVEMRALVGMRPCLLSLRELLAEFVEFRMRCVRGRTETRLALVRDKVHKLEGEEIALDQPEETIAAVRASKTRRDLRETLAGAPWNLTVVQANQVADMRISRFTQNEADKLEKELRGLREESERLELLLSSDANVVAAIDDELAELSKRFEAPRRTKLVEPEVSVASNGTRKRANSAASGTAMGLQRIDPIASRGTEVVLELNDRLYAKRYTASEVTENRRGTVGIGGGKAAARAAADDGVNAGDDRFLRVLRCSSNDVVLFFTETGTVFAVEAFKIPAVQRTSNASGMPLSGLVDIGIGERVTAWSVLSPPLLDDTKEEYVEPSVIFVTRNGQVKKMDVADVISKRSPTTGVNAITLGDGDEVVWAGVCDPSSDLVVATNAGYVTAFSLSKVRNMGRGARGITAMKLKGLNGIDENDVVIVGGAAFPSGSIPTTGEGDEKSASSTAAKKEPNLLMVTREGFARLTPASHFRLKNRGGVGLQFFSPRVDRDEVVDITYVPPSSKSVLVSTRFGAVACVKMGTVARQSRTGKGTALMKLRKGDAVRELCLNV
ncbi:DNA gyrase subunit A [Pycnococcus provasolii]